MSKIFWSLVFLSAVGAGILLWLMKTVPVPPPASNPEKEVVATSSKDTHGAAPGTGAEHGDKSVLTINTDPVKALVFVDGELKGETPVSIPMDGTSKTVKITAEGYEDLSRDIPNPKDAGGSSMLWKINLKSKSGGHAVNAKSVPAKGAHATESSHEAPVVATKKGEATAPAAAAQASAVKPRAEERHADKATHEPRAKEAQAGTEKPKAAVEQLSQSSDLFLTGKSGPAFIQVKAIAVSEGADAWQGRVRELRKELQLPVTGCRVDLGDKGEWMRVLVGPFESKRQAQTRLARVKEAGEKEAFVTGVQTCL